jgi:tetratricopeptide (TPR) repeat protein
VADAFVKANRQNEAIGLLKEFPENAGAREELGRLYLAGNQPAAAIEEFQAAVGVSPTPANRLALATAYLKNNQPKLAAPILEEALASHPNDYELRMAVGRLNRDGHNYKAAAEQFMAAANTRPDSVEAWNEAAGAFILAEQYGQALAALDKIHNLNADKPGNLYFRAVVLDKLHQIKPALASYQKFLQVSEGKFPDQEFIARQRSRLLAKEASR